MWEEARAAADSDWVVWVFLDGRGRGSIIWIALDGGFFRLAGCLVLRMISVLRGSGISTASNTWSFWLSAVLKDSSGPTEDIAVNEAARRSAGSFSQTLSSLAGGGKIKRGYVSQDVSLHSTPLLVIWQNSPCVSSNCSNKLVRSVASIPDERKNKREKIALEDARL